MLVDKDDLNRVLQRWSEPVQLCKAVLGKVIPPDNCTVAPCAVVTMSLDPKALAVVLDELAEHGDARVEGDDEGDCRKRSA